MSDTESTAPQHKNDTPTLLQWFGNDDPPVTERTGPLVLNIYESDRLIESTIMGDPFVRVTTHPKGSFLGRLGMAFAVLFGRWSVTVQLRGDRVTQQLWGTSACGTRALDAWDKAQDRTPPLPFDHLGH